FGIAAEVDALRAGDRKLAPLYSVKRLFVQRNAARKYPAAQAEAFDGDVLRAELERRFGDAFTELRFAEHVDAWMDAAAEHAAGLEAAAKYAAWATHSAAGKQLHSRGVLFKVPHKTSPERLVPVETEVVNGVPSLSYPPTRWRGRTGFDLTDAGTDTVG